MQEQLLLNYKEKVFLESFSPSELLKQLETYHFKPDFVFIPVGYFSEIIKWQNENGQFIIKPETASSESKLRYSLGLGKDINPKLIFSSVYRPLQGMILLKSKSIKWHIKVDPEFGALSIRLGNSNLYSDQVELFASTTFKCEIDSQGVLVFVLPK